MSNPEKGFKPGEKERNPEFDVIIRQDGIVERVEKNKSRAKKAEEIQKDIEAKK